MKLFIIVAAIMLCTSCVTVPTGEVRKSAGKKYEKVIKKLGPMTLYEKWEVIPSAIGKTMESIQAPARLVNKIVIPGFIVCLALTLVSQCPIVQKRCLQGAIVCGIAMPICWALMFATSSPLILIPLIIGVALVGYSVCRKRGLLFLSQEAV